MNNITNKRSAVLLGASGLVGGYCLDALIKDDAYGKVVLLLRRKIHVVHPKVTQYVVDFDHLDKDASLINGDDLFCCLGTTIKIAKTKEAFYKVDYSYPLEAAKIAVKNKMQKILVVTALGANARSPIFYNRVKGKLENELIKLNIPALCIFQPSLLIGKRKEPRMGEQVGETLVMVLKPLLIGPLKKYRAIKAQNVAKAMVTVAKHPLKGVNIFTSDKIQAVAEKGANYFKIPLL